MSPAVVSPAVVKPKTPSPHVLLVGMMGAGKSTVGRLLARRLGHAYVDSDQEIEARTGRTVKELFDAGGEESFRSLETDVLAGAVDRPDPVVVSVAGGAVMDPANRKLLAGAGTVVWLRASPSTLASRLCAPEARPHRPLLGDDPDGLLGRIEQLDAARRPLYAQVADAVIDVDHMSAAEVADKVAEVLGGAR